MGLVYTKKLKIGFFCDQLGFLRWNVQLPVFTPKLKQHVSK